MAYKKQSARQEQVKNELLAAAATQGKDFLEYDPVGLPDETDLENVKNIMRAHERIHPGEVRACVVEAKKDQELAKFDSLHGTLKSGTMRRTLSIPPCLMRMIEEAYPLMFSNREHLAWFKKNFRQLRTY